MNKIGIIVDGPGDLLSISKKYPSFVKVLKTDGPRGHYAPVDKIIAKSRKQISMLKSFNCSKVIVLLDFENRNLPYTEFISQLETCILNQNFEISVSVVVSNRMIENWYLADVEFLSKKKKYLKDNVKQKNYEGTNGKEELKKLFKPNFQYQETEHGPDLFCLVREREAAKNSISFKSFLENLTKMG